METIPSPQVSNWLQVGELVAGFGGNEFELTDALLGSQHRLTFEDGSVAAVEFGMAHEVTCSVPAPGGGADLIKTERIACTVTGIRAGIFFVDFLPSADRGVTVSLVIDASTGLGTAIWGRLPSRENTEQSIYSRAIAGQELTPVEGRVLHFSISNERPGLGRRHEATTDLVGRRMLYDYGARDLYEHVYLNDRYYTWQCLRGPEKGLEDTDRCYYYKIADELYLFLWLEKIIPTLGTVLVDTRALRTTGKLFGYVDSNFNTVINKRVGARARLLNITTYE